MKMNVVDGFNLSGPDGAWSVSISWPGGKGWAVVRDLTAVGTSAVITFQATGGEGGWSNLVTMDAFDAAELREFDLPPCDLLFSVAVTGSDTLASGSIFVLKVD